MLLGGIDVGSLKAQAVLVENGKIAAYKSIGVKPHPIDSAQTVMGALLEELGLTSEEIAFTVSTGYGREQVQEKGLSQANVSEISCHGIGAQWLIPEVRTIIDIGGQDAKVIRMDTSGELKDFVMNDKCAAGTGPVLAAYADDFVVLCRRKAGEVLEITRRWMEQMGLELNPDKTSVRNAAEEHFDFLGYTFGMLYWPVNGAKYLGATPSRKAERRIRRHVRSLLRPGNMDAWDEVVLRLNRTLRGWANYYSYGTQARVRYNVDAYVYGRVRHFLRRRSKHDTRGTKRFPAERVFGELGVLSIRRLPRRSMADAL
jgi:plasmid stabilization system protein ParE